MTGSEGARNDNKQRPQCTSLPLFIIARHTLFVIARSGSDEAISEMKSQIRNTKQYQMTKTVLNSDIRIRSGFRV